MRTTNYIIRYSSFCWARTEETLQVHLSMQRKNWIVMKIQVHIK